MKIRTRIISYVFISCFAVITLFSAYIYDEMRELIIKAFDARIAQIGTGLTQKITQGKSIGEIVQIAEYEKVFIVVSSAKGRYASRLAEVYEYPDSSKKKFTKTLVRLDNDKSKGAFRFLRSEVKLGDEVLVTLIGVSMNSIKDETDEMFISLLVSALLAFAAIGILGVLISNSILKPVREIINSSGNINSRNLDSRITVPDSKDEIYELTLTLNSLFDRLEKSFNLQKEFITNISHEIKTPLTVMNMITDSELQTALAEERDDKYPMKMYNNLNRINKLMKDIIRLSYLETNQLVNIDNVDLKSITKEILDNLSDMIEARGLSVQTDFGDCAVKGDKELIYSALMNLIYNAVKYSTNNGRIEIATSESAGRAEFAIANTCEDIPEGSLEKLFERFYRVEQSRSREYGGAGLGLAIVKEIIQKHDGQIAVVKPDKNSICFKFII